MITDRDIWRTAWDMIQEFSGEGYIHAAIKADDRLAEGDIFGQHVWMSVSQRHQPDSAHATG
jgi:hypothetical protein